jgi:hypothetical protein
MLFPLLAGNVSYGPPSTIARFTCNACSNRRRPKGDLGIAGCGSQARRGAKLISRVVDAVWLIVPLVPVIVSDNA